MMDRSRWSRRQFVRMAGCSSLGAMALGLPRLAPVSQASDKAAPRFAFIGFDGKGANGAGISVFDVRGAQWRQTSTVASQAPSSLVLDTGENYLYVVNEINEHEGLPSGTVEAYTIDAVDGRLRLLNRQRLSLSATAPRHAAVSPDGRALVVAVHGGGAYNVLPIREDGSLEEVVGILKETGSGLCEEQRSAHPQMVVFDPAGRVVSTDLGSDRLSVFNLNAARLSVSGRYEAQAGHGPRQAVFHPDGRLLIVSNGLDASVACYRYNADQGRIEKKLAQVATSRGENTAGVLMAMDPAGEFLYTAHRSGVDGVSMWKINRDTGRMRRLQIVNVGVPQLNEISVTSDGESLVGLSSEQSGVFVWRVANGQIAGGKRVANVVAPMSVAVKSS